MLSIYWTEAFIILSFYWIDVLNILGFHLTEVLKFLAVTDRIAQHFQLLDKSSQYFQALAGQKCSMEHLHILSFTGQIAQD
jgi:hypothetical protein